MTPESVVFYVFATIVVGSAAVVVLARSLIVSAFSLLFTFVGVAALYFLLGADFLATTQLLIYVGGILVLLIFGVMLTHRIDRLDLRSGITQFGPGLIVAVGVFAVLTAFALRTEWRVGPGRLPAPTTQDIGHAFLSSYLLPFEAASILLLVALIGAALIVRQRSDA